MSPQSSDDDAGERAVADGFSCREQIAQSSERRALHLAQVLLMAFNEGQADPNEYPETGYVVDQAARTARSGRIQADLLGIGTLSAAADILVWRTVTGRR